MSLFDQGSTPDKLLVALITALNAARRTVRSYPSEHPAIKDAYRRVVAATGPLLHSGREVALGAASKGLVFRGEFLDTGNAVYTGFASMLFEYGIGALILHAGLTVRDLQSLIGLLTLRREDVLARGGIGKIWSETGSTTVTVVPVHYELFKPPEVPRIDEGKRPTPLEGLLWEQFLRELTSRQQSSTALLAAHYAAGPARSDGIPVNDPDQEEAASPGPACPELPALERWAPAPGGDDCDLQDLEPDRINSAIANILLFFLEDPCADGSIEKAIVDLYRSHLCLGEYHDVAAMVREVLASATRQQTRTRLLDGFASAECMAELAGGIRAGGQGGHQEISTVVSLLGTRCLPPLLHLLAQEKSMKTRRFIMERIIAFGAEASEQVRASLRDAPWYFVRNLLIILREIKDRGAAGSIRPLLNHRNEVVRQEALKTLLHLGDARASLKLVQELSSGNHNSRLSALRLCSGCASGTVFQEVAKVATRFAVTSEAYQEREAAVTALAESGRAESVKVLADILDSHNVLARRQHLKLKKLCLLLLEKYFPVSLAKPVVARVSEEGGELGATVSAVLLRMEKKRA